VWHVLAAVFRGRVDGDADPAWEADESEIRRVAWVDPETLTPETTHPNFWPVLRRAGLMRYGEITRHPALATGKATRHSATASPVKLRARKAPKGSSLRS
jgi:hypothetical protein